MRIAAESKSAAKRVPATPEKSDGKGVWEWVGGGGVGGVGGGGGGGVGGRDWWNGLPRHRRSGALVRFVEVIHIKSSVFMPRHRRDRAHIRFVAFPYH